MAAAIGLASARVMGLREMRRRDRDPAPDLVKAALGAFESVVVDADFDYQPPTTCAKMDVPFERITRRRPTTSGNWTFSTAPHGGDGLAPSQRINWLVWVA